MTLDSMTYGGYAFARTPQGPVFVRHAMAGERADVRIDRSRKGVRFGTAVSLLSADAQRVPTVCPHFGPGLCGGCQWQFMPVDAQRHWKALIVQEQFRRIGGFADIPVQPTVPSPADYGYRAHLTLQVDPHGRPGFIAEDERTLMPISQCALASPSLAHMLREVLQRRWVGPRRLRLIAGARDDDRLVVLDHRLKSDSESSSLPLALLDGEGIAHPYSAHGRSGVRFVLAGHTFEVNGGSFFQANPDVAERLMADVAACIPTGTESVLDLYAGVGLFSAVAKSHSERVVSVELAAASSRDARINLAGLHGVQVVTSDAVAYLLALTECAQVVIVDPPRAGLGAEACAALLRHAPSRIVYISCDPTTLARDARALCSGGYAISSVQPYDMFPQTYHVECLLVLDYIRN